MRRFFTYSMSVFIYFGLIAENDSASKFEELKDFSLEELMNMKISGVSKFEEKMGLAPASVTIITEKQIKNRLYFYLSDVLKDINFIDAVDNARGFGEYYTIRGIGGNDRFLVLIDGIEINPTNGAFLSVGNSISISFAKRIEIITGPVSAIYGADAYSCVINIISKDIEGKVGEDINISGNVSYGSFNSIYANLNSSMNINDDLSFFASIDIFNSDGIDMVGRDKEYDVINEYKAPFRNKFEQPIKDHNIFIKSQYKNFSLFFIRQYFNEGNAMGLSPSSYVFNEENKWIFSNNIIGSSYRHKFSDNSQLVANLNYIIYEQDPNSQFLKWSDGEFSESFSQYITGINNTLRGDINLKHTFNSYFNLISGLEFEATSSIPPYANDQVFAEPLKYEGDVAKQIDNELTINQQRYAVFAQGTYSPLDWVDFLVGGRFDYFTLYEDTFNPRLGLVINPWESTNIKLLYGTAFQAPSLFYQYEQWGNSSAVMLSESEVQEQINPNWSLKNQEVVTWGLDITQKISEDMTFRISGFHSELHNLIMRNIFTNDTVLVKNKYFSTEDSSVYSVGIRNENMGEQKIYGVDMEFNWKISENINFNIMYSFTDAHFTGNGEDKEIARVAPHKVFAGIELNNIIDLLNLSIRYRYYSSIYNRNTNVFPSGQQPGYNNIDMSIRTTEFWELGIFYIKINNLLNSDYSQGGLFNQETYLPTIPQAMLNAYIGLELNFR